MYYTPYCNSLWNANYLNLAVEFLKKTTAAGKLAQQKIIVQMKVSLLFYKLYTNRKKNPNIIITAKQFCL